jgi:hypothetical protein
MTVNEKDITVDYVRRMVKDGRESGRDPFQAFWHSGISGKGLQRKAEPGY